MGKVRVDIDNDIAAHIYAGMIRQIVSRQGLEPRHAPYDVFKTAIKILFEGILTSESKNEFRDAPAPRFPTGDTWDVIKREAEGATGSD